MVVRRGERPGVNTCNYCIWIVWIAKEDDVFHTMSTFTGYRQFEKEHINGARRMWPIQDQTPTTGDFVILPFKLACILCLLYELLFRPSNLKQDVKLLLCREMSESLLDMFRKAGTAGAAAFVCLFKLWMDVAFLSSQLRDCCVVFASGLQVQRAAFLFVKVCPCFIQESLTWTWHKIH